MTAHLQVGLPNEVMTCAPVGGETKLARSYSKVARGVRAQGQSRVPLLVQDPKRVVPPVSGSLRLFASVCPSAHRRVASCLQANVVLFVVT